MRTLLLFFSFLILHAFPFGPRTISQAVAWGKLFRQEVRAPKYREVFQKYLQSSIILANGQSNVEEFNARAQLAGTGRKYPKDWGLQELQEDVATARSLILKELADASHLRPVLAGLDEQHKAFLKQIGERNRSKHAKMTWLFYCACHDETNIK